jgi:cytochrome c biogenesis protein
LTTNKRGLATQLWDFFCSLKLTLFLLIGLALTSIIGTVVQQGPQREYLATLSETKIRLYSALGFFDMYHSWWFILLLYLLTLNLICCSIKRLPRVWKIVFEPVFVMDERFEKSLTSVKELKLKGSKAELKERLSSFLKAEFAEPTLTEQDGSFHLFAQKNRLCRLGVYVVHFSIIIIFIGALLGSFFGYKAYVNIPEGGNVTQVQGRTGKPIDLGFAVRCEKFSVAFYDTGAPKEFRSVLTVLENGQPVKGFQNVPIIVNDPLTYKGITFYQSSYGQSDEGALYHISVTDRKGRSSGWRFRIHHGGDPKRASLHEGLRRAGGPGGIHAGRRQAAVLRDPLRQVSVFQRPARRRSDPYLRQHGPEVLHWPPGRQGPGCAGGLAWLFPDGMRYLHGLLHVTQTGLVPDFR